MDAVSACASRAEPEDCRSCCCWSDARSPVHRPPETASKALCMSSISSLGNSFTWGRSHIDLSSCRGGCATPVSPRKRWPPIGTICARCCGMSNEGFVMALRPSAAARQPEPVQRPVGSPSGRNSTLPHVARDRLAPRDVFLVWPMCSPDALFDRLRGAQFRGVWRRAGDGVSSWAGASMHRISGSRSPAFVGLGADARSSSFNAEASSSGRSKAAGRSSASSHELDSSWSASTHLAADAVLPRGTCVTPPRFPSATPRNHLPLHVKLIRPGMCLWHTMISQNSLDCVRVRRTTRGHPRPPTSCDGWRKNIRPVLIRC
jgi:hypothetical protein